ncbi:DUF7535 family protein (plasmid) [Haloplanus ruber]|uniref:DUF7535 family protein n=1 Tax=Haloplanus ruber TaxID=869892 RepID=UPI003C6FC557
MTSSVNRSRTDRSNTQMSVLGYLIAAPIVLMILPVLPALGLLWIGDKISPE